MAFSWPTGLERVAEQMESIALVRSLVSKEGDHQRGTYLVKTGYRPDPTAVHPSIGAICCHELPAAGTEIPRHISILPNQWPARGGFLGDEFDAFKTGDPAKKVSDVTARVADPRIAAAAGRPGRARSAASRRGRQRGGRSDAARRARPRRAADDDLRAAARRSTSSQEPAGAAGRVRRHAVRPRLPGRAAADRGRRALRRSDARRLGQPRQQPRDSTAAEDDSRSGLRRPRRPI